MNRIPLRRLATLAAACLVLASAGAVAQHSHAPAAGAAAAQLQLDNGKRWATDVPLRRGMGEIRNQVTSAPKAVHAGKARPAEYKALAMRIEKETGRIVAECKLEPRADAQLHLVVADLLAGIESMKGAANGAAGRAGLLQVAAALDAYGRHFDHPGWKPVG